MTTLSVRQSRDFNGPVISLVALARMEKRTFPVSVREMATMNQILWTDQISAGDVLCVYVMVMFSNGAFYATADFHDNGTSAGDGFILDLLVNVATSLGVTLIGQVEAGATVTLLKRGLDPWIRENWATVARAPVKAHLHVAPNVGEIVSEIARELLDAGSGSCGGTTAQPCPDQADDDQACCVQYTGDGDGDSNEGGNGGDDE